MISSWDIGQIPAIQSGSAGMVEPPNAQADTTVVSAGQSGGASADAGMRDTGTSDRGAREDRGASRPPDAGAESIVAARLSDPASAAAEPPEDTETIDRYKAVLRDLSDAAQATARGAEKGTFAANDVGKLPV